MLQALARLLGSSPDERPGPPAEGDRDRACRIAGAALLVEMGRADYEVKPVERAAAESALVHVFELDAAGAAALYREAERHADDATSLYEFTRLINRHFQPAEKERLIEFLWFVAFADGELDKYEEHLVRRVADLIYVPHAAFIRTKHRAGERLGGQHGRGTDRS